MEQALRRLPPRPSRTRAYDKGRENALHELVNEALGRSGNGRSYFCKPYHPWEKGSIENRNGILRRYYPKKHDFAC